MSFARLVHTTSEVTTSIYKILVTALLGYYLLRAAKRESLKDKQEVHP